MAQVQHAVRGETNVCTVHMLYLWYKLPWVSTLMFVLYNYAGRPAPFEASTVLKIHFHARKKFYYGNRNKPGHTRCMIFSICGGIVAGRYLKFGVFLHKSRVSWISLIIILKKQYCTSVGLLIRCVCSYLSNYSVQGFLGLWTLC